ncbi:MAG TPA: LamG domain-containing protein [Candidatus Obscuribacterales bacterium]
MKKLLLSFFLLFFSCQFAYAACDTNTQLMLHLNGTDGSTTITDSSPSPKTVTVAGNAQIDTAQSVFGGASGLFDGTGDYLESADNAAWQLGGGTGAFTIDFRVRFAAFAAINQFFSQINDAETDGWVFYYFNTSNQIRFISYTSSAQTLLSKSWTPSLDTWYHIALVRSGNTWRFFVDGTQLGTDITDTVTIPNTANRLLIGAAHETTPSEFINGWIDEARISNEARFGGNFTPSGSEYCGGSKVMIIQ